MPLSASTLDPCQALRMAVDSCHLRKHLRHPCGEAMPLSASTLDPHQGSQDARRFLHVQETLPASLWRIPAFLCIRICIHPLRSLLVSASSAGRPRNASQFFAVSHYFIRVITVDCSINTFLSVPTVSCEEDRLKALQHPKCQKATGPREQEGEPASHSQSFF